MRLAVISTLCVAITGVISHALPLNSSDGFPNPSPAQLVAIEKKAGGPLPDGSLPTSLKAAAITSLTLLANNELFEVAFFTELLANITKNVSGYDEDSMGPHCSKDFAIKAITAILAVRKRPTSYYLPTNPNSSKRRSTPSVQTPSFTPQAKPPSPPASTASQSQISPVPFCSPKPSPTSPSAPFPPCK